MSLSVCLRVFKSSGPCPAHRWSFSEGSALHVQYNHIRSSTDGTSLSLSLPPSMVLGHNMGTAVCSHQICDAPFTMYASAWHCSPPAGLQQQPLIL